MNRAFSMPFSFAFSFASFTASSTIYGSDHITDTLCGLQFKISPFSFWQINRKQAEKLYGKAKEYANLKSDEILLDLYCGTGTIGLTMADSCKQLIGAEISLGV